MAIASAFRRYADWVADKSELYAALAETAADDRRLLDIASEAPAGQPEPELLLAAVHSNLLRDPDHPLAQFYPTCEGSGTADRPESHFRDFCLRNEDELREVIAARRCQTNEVNRSAVLLPAFEHVARAANSETVAQIEIGASAGLNLNWDRYRYDFDGVGRFGETESPVTITTDVRGDCYPPLPRQFPTVTHRRGIDLNTLDVTDEADARWLHALIPPNQERRHRRLEAAIEVARENRPPLIEGDVLETLPRQLSEAPNDGALVVFSTHVLYQLDDDAIATLRTHLASHSADRRIHWLSIDPDEGLGTPTYRSVVFEDGTATETQIARFESYGEWIRWIGS